MPRLYVDTLSDSLYRVVRMEALRPAPPTLASSDGVAMMIA